MSGIPIDGRTVYVRLASFLGGAWQIRDYTYTARAPLPSEVFGPLPGSVLNGTAVTFHWTPGTNVTERYLTVGSTVGGTDVYAGYQGAATSRALSNLPADGRRIYVSLSSWLNGAWRRLDYTYTAFGTASAPEPAPAPSIISSPATGATLLADSVTLHWSSGYGVTERYLMVGSISGAADIYGAYVGAALSTTVLGIPTDGRTIHVKLSSWVNGAWQSSSVTYIASGSGPPPATPAKSNLVSPAGGSVLAGSSVTFQWDAGASVGERYLALGSSAGGSDIFGGYQGASLSRTVGGIPTDGRTIYATLSSWIGGGWQSSTATYTAASGGGPAPSGPASEITSPAPGSSLGVPGSSSATFSWTAGTGVAERYLMVGTTAGGSQVYAAYQGAGLSRTVSGAPCGTATIYVRLMSYVGSWIVKDYLYTSAGCPP